ncbi:MAG TPA: class I SAM-dependent methyltransferase [Gaiellaceae bacterium]|nr:class I SAM-dependent methyltransferase [Gaiellaceae bacterium]
MATTELDPARAEAFAGRTVQILNDAMLSLLLSVGHQTRLLDVMAAGGAVTSEELADAASLEERYVREWLAGLTVGGILQHDPDTATYLLPAEHAACLTRAAGPNNLASFAQYTALFGELEQQVVDCFRNGGGVPYSAMPRFQALQAEESAQIHDGGLIEVTLPLVDGLVGRLRAGIDVIDVGCGHGHAANLIADAFPASRVTGIDISEQGIAAAKAEADELRLTNARFELRDALTFEPGAYDLVTAFDVIHDLPRPAETLRAIHAALRDGGVFLMVDIAASSHVQENLEHPLGPALYTASIFHCMTVSLAGGGPGLGTMWGKQTALELLAEAGFHDVEVKSVEADFLNSYYIARKR